MIKKPENILKEWMSAVNKGDIKSLLSFYDKKAILIPTFSNRILSSPKEIRKYFERLLSREELSLAFHNNTLNIQSIKNDTYVLSGIYCWRFAIAGELFSFEARFCCIMDLALLNPIIHHHSSQIPIML